MLEIVQKIMKMSIKVTVFELKIRNRRGFWIFMQL